MEALAMRRGSGHCAREPRHCAEPTAWRVEQLAAGKVHPRAAATTAGTLLFLHGSPWLGPQGPAALPVLL